MALKGSIEEAALADIFQLLALGEKSGCLSVTDHQNFGHVYFRSGRVAFANLVNREDRLGERLVSGGRVDEAELEAALERQRAEPDRRLGQLLVEDGAVSPEDLAKAVAEQVEDAVYALLGWDRGYFHFEAGQQLPQTDVVLSLDVANLVLEGARRADEWEHIKKRIPHRHLVLARVSGLAPETGAGARERGFAPREDLAAVWQALDGVRDVSDVAQVSRLDEFRALKALHDLLAAGRVRVVGEAAAAPDGGLRRREEYRDLGLAFYAARMFSEAAREFRQMASLNPRDAEAHFHLGLVAFRTGDLTRAREDFSRVVELRPDLPAGYLNLALALEALGRLEEAEMVLAELLTRFPDSAPGKLHQAILRYRRGAHAEALALLEGLEVGEDLAPIANFYRAMLHTLLWDLRSARELLGTIPQDRQNARILNNLGAVLERGDRLEEARLSYSAALELGGAGGTARKNLGDLYYREAKYEQARMSYLLALKDDPANAEALHRLGNIAMKQGRRQEAMYYWERALASEPAHGRAHDNLALARAETSPVEPAEAT